MAAPMFWSVVGGITALKLLLIQSYKSTDFEVHRNWLAVTHNLPVSKWYSEATSEWTLDYPPFFAWFECALSYMAKFFDVGMLSIQKSSYSSPGTVVFQRLSVIVTDLVFAYAAKECCSCLGPATHQSKKDIWLHHGFILLILLFGNAGLLMVDHIHFQYNGFLFGLLMLSVARMIQFRYLESAVWFAILLNFKHIFLYIAPAYFVFLLRSHCFLRTQSDGRVEWSSFSIPNFFKLGISVISIFLISLGPFIWQGQLGQVLSRLFPFKRGLCHAYWAPNFWALYNLLDKCFSVVGAKLGIVSGISNTGAMTGGLVQEYNHAVLPSVSPTFALILSVVSCLPALARLWNHANRPWEFVRCLVLCAFGSFIFGWHVHEKAILLVIIPLTVLSVVCWNDASTFTLLSLTGHFSLFPLFFTSAEFFTKILLFTLHATYTYFSLSLLHRETARVEEPLLSKLELLYALGFVVVQLYQTVFHGYLGFDQQLPFLPLLLFSGYCAVGVLYCWIKFYRTYLFDTAKPWEKRS